MAHKNPWVNAIKNCSRKQLSRVEQFLFVNVSLTLTYLIALQTVGQQYNRLTAAQQACYTRLVVQVRQTVLRLEPQKLADVLIALWDSGLSAQIRVGCNKLILGTELDDSEEQAEGMINRLIDALNLYRTVPAKADYGACLLMALNSLVALPGNSRVGTNTWDYFLLNVRSTGNNRTLRRLLDLCYGLGTLTRITPVPWSMWQIGSNIYEFDEVPFRWWFPVMDCDLEWFTNELENIANTLEEEDSQVMALIARIMSGPKPYQDLYETMWLEMMCEPVHGLRPDGLDRVRIKHAALKSAGYVELILYPEAEFPRFKAQFIRRPHYGGEHAIEMLLEPSELLLVMTPFTMDQKLKVTLLPGAIWMDKLLAFVAVRAMSLIVMDRLPKSNGKGNGKGGAAAIVRPIFRKLPLGHKASEEARARALSHFRTEPLPGFTFVRGYKRGESPNSGEPIFDLDEVLAGLPTSSG